MPVRPRIHDPHQHPSTPQAHLPHEARGDSCLGRRPCPYPHTDWSPGGLESHIVHRTLTHKRAVSRTGLLTPHLAKAITSQKGPDRKMWRPGKEGHPKTRPKAPSRPQVPLVHPAAASPHIPAVAGPSLTFSKGRRASTLHPAGRACSQIQEQSAAPHLSPGTLHSPGTLQSDPSLCAPLFVPAQEPMLPHPEQ